MYVGHTNALTAVLMILPARWAGVALQPLSVPFGPAGVTHACRAASSAEHKRGKNPISKFE